MNRILSIVIAGLILISCTEKKEPIILTDLELKMNSICLLYTLDAADERSSVDLGGRRIIKKKKN